MGRFLKTVTQRQENGKINAGQLSVELRTTRLFVDKWDLFVEGI
jgi:hypothetical protein